MRRPIGRVLRETTDKKEKEKTTTTRFLTQTETVRGCAAIETLLCDFLRRGLGHD